MWTTFSQRRNNRKKEAVNMENIYRIEKTSRIGKYNRDERGKPVKVTLKVEYDYQVELRQTKKQETCLDKKLVECL